jgi:cell division septation protein DedD
LAQDIERYLGLINEGRIDDVRSALPELEALYKNDPGVQYIKALVTLNGEEALVIYRDLLRNHPDHVYADDVAMKIGEYLFSRGLYTQASKQFRLVPLVYTTTEHVQRATDLMVNSYMATGQRDSAAYYVRQIRSLHPTLEYDHYGMATLMNPPEEAKLVKLDEEKVSAKINDRKQTRRYPKPNPTIPKPRPSKTKDFVVQVGAFSKYESALRIKNLLLQGGFKVEIIEVPSAGRRLHAVRVLRFYSMDQAETEGERVKGKYGLEYRVLNRPE